MKCSHCNAEMQEQDVRECPYCGAKSCSNCVRNNRGRCPYCDGKMY